MNPASGTPHGGWSRLPWRPSSDKPAPPSRDKPGLAHLFLFFLTVLTTTVAGVGLTHHPAPMSLWLSAQLIRVEPMRLLDGMAFSGPLLTILFAHEMGHYAVARLWRVPASWPFFVPLPVGLGTMGALITMGQKEPGRKALLEIGAAGPLAGFLAAMVFLITGLNFSAIRTAEEMRTFVHMGGLSMPDSMALGLSRFLVFGAMPPEREVALHPMAMAGWYGLYLTWFNLLPFGQLDGGHIMRAAYPTLARTAALTVILLHLILWWATGSQAWLAVLTGLLLLGVLSGGTPPPLADDASMRAASLRQWMVLVTCALVFLLCFVSDPLPRTGP